MARGRAGSRTRPRSAESVVVPFPGAGRDAVRVDLTRAALVRAAPSGRSLLIAFGLLAAVVAGWLVARESSLFGVRTIRVEQAPPPVAAQVRRVLADLEGRSLLRVDTARAERAVEQLPTVQTAAIDRAFPNDLHVVVVPERAVALVRQGPASAVVSARGRMMRLLDADAVAQSELPRIWVPKSVELAPGTFAQGELAVAVRAVTPLATGGFPARVASVRATTGELTLRLRSGLEVKLGDVADADLKLAVAARVLPLLEEGTRSLDVSVPERPVSSQTLDSQVEVEGTTSTLP